MLTYLDVSTIELSGFFSWVNIYTNKQHRTHSSTKEKGIFWTTWRTKNSLEIKDLTEHTNFNVHLPEEKSIPTTSDHFYKFQCLYMLVQKSQGKKVKSLKAITKIITDPKQLSPRKPSEIKKFREVSDQGGFMVSASSDAVTFSSW